MRLALLALLLATTQAAASADAPADALEHPADRELSLEDIEGLGQEDMPRRQTAIVVLGGYGNLATKYLWQALFDLWRTEGEGGIEGGLPLFVGAGTAEPARGRGKLDAALARGVSCEVADRECGRAFRDFSALVRYEQLKTDEDYLRLSRVLEMEARKAHVRELGRFFYLSVPPSAYPEIARRLALSRPADGDVWLRAVVEKPFGHDLPSAEALAETVGGYLKDDEVYRVDHYHGKALVQALPAFLGLNAGYALGRDAVRLAHVSMEERETAEGRTWFYTPVGVVRDVLQNHLTQLLTSAALAPAAVADLRAEAHERAAVLDALRVLAPPRTRQYASYLDHVRADGADEAAAAGTPTAAAVVLEVANEQWAGVPWVMTAGKALDEREAFVRLYLHAGDEDCAVTLSVQGGALGTAISVCDALPEPVPPPGWVADADNARLLRPEAPPLNAYRVLLEQALQGEQHNFLGMDELLRSWGVWSPLVSAGPSAGSPVELYEVGHEGWDVAEVLRGVGSPDADAEL